MRLARENKYHNLRTEGSDSTKERLRGNELRLLEQAGVISSLVVKPRFRIEVCGVHVCDYIADYRYTENGVVVVEDVKPKFKDDKARARYRNTPAYRMFSLKRKLMKAVLGIEILET